MAANYQDLVRWKETAKEFGYKYIISVCDTFDWDDYPVYCKDAVELESKRKEYDGVGMQRINEVIEIEYDEK